MPSPGFENTIAEIKRPQSYSLDCKITGIDQQQQQQQEQEQEQQQH